MNCSSVGACRTCSRSLFRRSLMSRKLVSFWAMRSPSPVHAHARQRSWRPRTASERDVVARPPSWSSTARRSTAATTSSRRRARVRGERRQQLALAELGVAGADLGHAVRVDSSSSPGAQPQRSSPKRRSGIAADERPAARLDELDAAVGPEHERRRVAAVGERAARCRRPRGTCARRTTVQNFIGCASACSARLSSARLAAGSSWSIEAVRSVCRASAVTAAASGALARDVADERRPDAVAAWEHVVEVAADLVLVAGGEEARGHLGARDLGQRARAQARLQRLRDVRALGVEAGVLDVQRRTPREAGEQLDVGLRQLPPRVAQDEGERADHAARAAQRRGHAVADVEPRPAAAGDRRPGPRRGGRSGETSRTTSGSPVRMTCGAPLAASRSGG